MEVFHEQRKQQHERDVVLAWRIAALQRAKHMPSLDSMLGRTASSVRARALHGQEAEDARRAHDALLKRMGIAHGG